jgi:hypothetical protein
MTQNQPLPAPWELISKDINDIPMLVVHMSKGELEGLDNLQGGPSVDEQTGMREYSALSPIIEIPEIREVFHDIANQLETHGNVSNDVKHAYKEAKEYSLPYRETDDEIHNPFLKRLEKMGRGGDSRLAYIPINLAEFLIEIRHFPSINPKSDLLEFGWFKEFIKVVGTIGGALIGGPIGAGAGRALAGIATGQKPGHAAMSGLQSGALAYGAQGLGQAAGLSGATPYTGGFFGGAPNALASGLNGMGIGKGITPVAAAASSGAQGMPAAQQLINSAFTQPQAPGLLGTIANVGNAIAPYAPLAVGALSYMGSKQHHKHLQKEHERQEAKWDEERKRLGWDIDWTPVAKKYEDNPDYWNITEDDIKHGRMEPYRREVGARYAKGGLVQSYNKCALVKGRGKGQDDFIETTVPVESYIVDASSTSMLGDGSSEAGYKVIKKLENDIKNKVPKKIRSYVERQVKKNTYQSPVYLSNDEVKLDPVFVSLLPYALGKKNTSNKEGADILRETIKNLRKHKSQSGSGLPPKAKPLLEYARM